MSCLVFATFTSFVHRVTTQSIATALCNSSQLNLTPKEVGFLFSIFGFTVFAMILPAGFVIDKVGRKNGQPFPVPEFLLWLFCSFLFLGLSSSWPCCLLFSALPTAFRWDRWPRRPMMLCRQAPVGGCKPHGARWLKWEVSARRCSAAFSPIVSARVCRFLPTRRSLCYPPFFSQPWVGRETLER